MKKMWLNLERTLDKRGRSDQMTAEKGHRFAEGDD